MIRHFTTAVALFFGLTFAVDAMAGPRVYLEVSPGVSVLSDSDIRGSGSSPNFKANFDVGYVFGAAVGFRLYEDFRIEVNASYRNTAIEKNGRGVGGRILLFSVMTNVYYDIDFGIPIKPYLGVGIGNGFVDVDILERSGTSVSNNKTTQFAWNVMAGIGYALSENFDLSAGYRYLGTTDAKFDAVFEDTDVGTFDVEIDFHEFLLGLRYTF